MSYAMNSALEKTTVSTTLMLVGVIAALIAGFSQRSQFEYQPKNEGPDWIDAKADPRGHARQYRMQQLDERFQQAVAMLHAKQYDYAVKALHRVLELAPKMPEAHINMGYALIGLKRYAAARDFFMTAVDLRPYQANAYWGLAISLEQLKDYEGALGAMRTFIHLSPPNDPYLRKARSALWEWESHLKRGPLPEAEKEWIERRSREASEINGPEADRPAEPDHRIHVKAEEK